MSAGGSRGKAAPEEQAIAGLEHEFAQAKATALGRAGRRLAATLAELRAFDAGHRAADAEQRGPLVAAAADALWMLVVQQEAIGLHSLDLVRSVYAVPDDVVALMGPKLEPPHAPPARRGAARS